jgi:hypothetical protein
MSTTYTPTDAKRATALEFDDGDAPQASTINPLAEAAFDTATFAANRVGVVRLINSWTTAVARGSTLGTQATSAYGSGAPYQINSFAVTSGDFITVRGFAHAKAASTTCEAHYCVGFQLGSGAIAWQTAEVEFDALTSSTVPIPISADYTVGGSGTLKVLLWCVSDDNVHTIQIESPLVATVEQLRSNS